VCIRCQVGSKVDYVVCEEFVGSAFGEEHIKKNLDAQLVQKMWDKQMVQMLLYYLFSGLFQ
jgi:hypothetical protein